MAQELVTALKNRRRDRFEAIEVRLKAFLEDSKYHKDTEAKEYIDTAMILFNGKVVTDCISKNNRYVYTRYLDIYNSDKDNFVEKIINALRYGCEIFIEKELYQTKKGLTDRFINGTIKSIPELNRDRYYDSVKYLVRLEKIRLINELEHDLSEIQKDMLSCIKYNEKIKKEELKK